MASRNKQLLLFGDEDDETLIEESSSTKKDPLGGHKFKKKAFKKTSASRRMKRKLDDDENFENGELQHDEKFDKSDERASIERETMTKDAGKGVEGSSAGSRISRIKKYERLARESGAEMHYDAELVTGNSSNDPDAPIVDIEKRYSNDPDAPVIVDMGNSYSNDPDAPIVAPIADMGNTYSNDPDAPVIVDTNHYSSSHFSDPDAAVDIGHSSHASVSPPATHTTTKYIPESDVNFFREKEVTLKNEYGDDDQLDDEIDPTPIKKDELDDVDMDDYLVEDGAATAADLIRQSKLRAGIHQTNQTPDKPIRRVTQINQDMYDLELSSGGSDIEDDSLPDHANPTASGSRPIQLSDFKTLEQMIEHLTITVDTLSETVASNEAQLQDTDTQLTTIRESKQKLLEQLSQ